MKRARISILALVVAIAVAACGGDAPNSTAVGGAEQVPPANAVDVTVTSAEIGAEAIVVRGEAPTPCHQLGSYLEQTESSIEVTVWSVPGDEPLPCAQVTQPFEISLSFEPPSSEVPVRVNGRAIGRVG